MDRAKWLDVWVESTQAVLGIERKITMSKHDEEFDEALRRLSEHASSFDDYVSIWMLEELHEIHTSLDFIYDVEVGREN